MLVRKLAKSQRNVSKVSDITGGLPKVTELFEPETHPILLLLVRLMELFFLWQNKRGNVKYLLKMNGRNKEENT